MITYVDSKNNGMYQTRFEQATMLLRDNHTIQDADSITTLEQYFMYLRDLALLDPYYTMLPVDEETLNIDADTRKIAIPADFAKNGVGVQGDEIAEVLYFTIDRFFDATDLSDASMQIAIQWETADHVAGVSKEFVRDITSYPGKLIFGWPLSSEITKKPGKIKFSVRFYKIGDRKIIADNGAEVTQQYLTYNFNTIPAELTINASLDYDLYGATKIDSIDRENLIVNRIVNSVLVDPSIPDAGVPVWVINLADINTIEAIYAPVNAMPETTPEEIAAKEAAKAAADIEAGKYLIKDLVNVGNVLDDNDNIIGQRLGYYLDAYATGNGAISYNWLKCGVNENREQNTEWGSVNTINNSFYANAIPGPMDKTKSYYVAINHYSEQTIHHDAEGVEGEDGYVAPYDETVLVADGIEGYKPQPWIPETPGSETGAMIVQDIANDKSYIVDTLGTQINLYERHSRAMAEESGMYHVVAVNSRLGKRESIDSYYVIFPVPKTPELGPVVSTQTIEANGETFNAVFDEETDDSHVIHMLLNSDNEALLAVFPVTPETQEAADNGWAVPAVSLSYQWYTSPGAGDAIYHDDNIDQQFEIQQNGTSDTYLVTGLSASDAAEYDETYFVKVTSTRNLSTAFTYSAPYRVTAAPKKPVLIAPLPGTNSNVRRYDIGRTVTLSLDELQHDSYTYCWKKFNSAGNETVDENEEPSIVLDYGDDDFFVDVNGNIISDGGENQATSAVFSPTVNGVYYCEITNHLNGATNMVRTPFYDFQERE